jgi:adenosylhomocysteine nucleosidase
MTDCRAVVLFALEREAGPLLWRFGLRPFWDIGRRVYAVRADLAGDPAGPAVGGPDVIVGFTGMGPAAAAAEARRVLALFRPPLVLSAGLCGGLRPGLAAGDVLVPAEVLGPDGRRWACAPAAGWRAGVLVTTGGLIGSPAAKGKLHAATGADAVDMEAAAVAEACAAAGVPFAAVKGVSDPADVGLPPELPSIAPAGRPRYGRLLLATVRRPRLLGELMRLDRDSQLAARTVCARAWGITGTPRERG